MFLLDGFFEPYYVQILIYLLKNLSNSKSKIHLLSAVNLGYNRIEKIV